MSLRIHAFPLSPRAFKALVVANHLGLDYEFCFLDLTKGAQHEPAFAVLNPNRKMPVLEEGAVTLWESNAIIQYLAAKKPEAGLLPREEAARADVTRWQFWDATTWDPAVAALVFERVVKGIFGAGPPDPAEEAKGLEKFNAAAVILDAHLKGRDTVCGDKLTLADFSLGSALLVAEQARLPLEPYAEIRRWGAQLTALPAWRATLAMQQPAVAA